MPDVKKEVVKETKIIEKTPVVVDFSKIEEKLGVITQKLDEINSKEEPEQPDYSKLFDDMGNTIDKIIQLLSAFITQYVTDKSKNTPQEGDVNKEEAQYNAIMQELASLRTILETNSSTEQMAMLNSINETQGTIEGHLTDIKMDTETIIGEIT